MKRGGPILASLAALLFAVALHAAPAAGGGDFDPLETECSFVLADPKAAGDPFPDGMKRVMAIYWIFGFMNGQAAEEESKTYIGLTDANVEAVLKTFREVCASYAGIFLSRATQLARERLIRSARK